MGRMAFAAAAAAAAANAAVPAVAAAAAAVAGSSSSSNSRISSLFYRPFIRRLESVPSPPSWLLSGGPSPLNGGPQLLLSFSCAARKGFSRQAASIVWFGRKGGNDEQQDIVPAAAVAAAAAAAAAAAVCCCLSSCYVWVACRSE